MILSLFTGILATIIGALPPGASNLAVVKTTAEENIKESLKISYGAAVGEIIIAILALCFGMMAQSVYQNNLWIQISFSVIMAGLGVYFIFKKQKPTDETKSKATKFIRGFLFGIVNPPVLVYWIALFSMLSGYFSIDEGSPWPVLLLFFAGVFIGKTATLYGYARLSKYIIARNGHFKTLVNRIIGVVLIVLALVQTAKLLFF